MKSGSGCAFRLKVFGLWFFLVRSRGLRINKCGSLFGGESIEVGQQITNVEKASAPFFARFAKGGYANEVLRRAVKQLI